jgi:hypothetical protein
MTIGDTLIGAGFGGIIVSLIAIGILLLIFASIAVYVYVAFAWMTIAKKLKCKYYWLAWIPVANFFLLPLILKKKWTWGLMFFVPVANIVFFILWTWKIFELRKYPGWLSLSVLVPKFGGILYLIAIGFVAWKDQKKKK